MKTLFLLVLLCAYHILIHGASYENPLEDIKLSISVDHEYIIEIRGTKSDEKCNQTLDIMSKICEWNKCSEYTQTLSNYLGLDQPRYKRSASFTPPLSVSTPENKTVLEYFKDITVEPHHYEFYKWLYKNIQKTNQSPHKILMKMLKDKTFTPASPTNTPFPIPEEYQKLYSWLLLQKNISLPDSAGYKKHLEDHFTDHIAPEFEQFYKWLYERLDYGKINVYQKIKEYIDDYFFTMAPEITNTPFPIPYKYWALYDWIIQPKLNLTRPTSPTPTTITTTELPQEVRSYFTGEADDLDKFKEFYKWYYIAMENGSANCRYILKKNFIDHDFTNLRTDETTPFPVPEVYRTWYHWLRLFRSPTPPTMATTRLEAKLKSTLENHFTETIESHYEYFYKWLYQALANGSENIYLKNQEWINDYHFSPAEDLTNTPFSIPYRHQALYEWISYQRANVTTTTVAPRVKRVKREIRMGLDSRLKATLENHFTETIGQEYEPFYIWLYKALNDGKDDIYQKNAEWIAHPTFMPSEDDRIPNTPFPIPLRHQALYEWFLYLAASTSTTLSAIQENRRRRVKRDLSTTPMTDPDLKEVQQYFTDETIKSEHEKFYSWFYNVIKKQNQSPQKLLHQFLQDKTYSPENQPNSTPFPIPSDYKELYTWLISQKDIDPPNQDVLKQKLENHFTETIEPQYLEFYHWLYKKLDNGRISIYQKIKEYIDDYFFTIAPVITNTPFPIPYRHWALYDWIVQPKLNQTRTTIPTTTPEPTTDLAKEARSYFIKDADYLDKYKEFYNWYYKAMENGSANCRHLLKKNFIDHAFLSIDYHEPTNFPIPSVYHSWYHWLRLFRSPTAPTVSHDRLDEKSKYILEQHFTETIPPYYEPFYKWLYEELDRGKINLYEKIGEWINDPYFEPSDHLTNKPFPIPYKHHALYEWIMHKKGNYTKGPGPTIQTSTIEYDQL